MLKINLGSGNSSDRSYTNVDIYPLKNVDVVHDIEKPLPFESDSADEILMTHSLEHCSMNTVPSLLKECYRILKKDGKIQIVVPCLECCMRNFLDSPESERWGVKIEYIFGNQGKSQTGQQFHKSGFTPQYLRKLIENAGFVIDSLSEINNSINNCIHLYAHK